MATRLLRVSAAFGQGAIEGDGEANNKAISACSTSLGGAARAIAHIAAEDGDPPCRAAVCSSSVATSKGVTPLQEITCMPWTLSV